jgi:hypothetical protein
MKTIHLPYHIVAVIHADGVSVRTRGDWVENDIQAAGLRSVLQVVGKALEDGADHTALATLIVPMIQALQENRIAMM